ncbi:transaldolase family protein [Sandaracinus amylolyticus]|nr:transaldolase family protein [Sandaracinus amylolyticus]
MNAISMRSSLLRQMTRETPTELWVDSCEPRALERAIARGATGATTNPVIVMQAIEADRPRWDEITRALVRDHPSDDEESIAWRLVALAASEGAMLLWPTFERHGGTRGRLCVQASPRVYRDASRMIGQAMQLAQIAPNVAVKLPTTAAGLVAMEELTARGVVINATVSFSVAQALAAASAVDRGLARLDPRVDHELITPWITIMAGRIDDHLRDLVTKRGAGKTPEIELDVDLVRHASTAIVRRAYRLFRERGHRATLLVAAMRSHHHWSEFIGGELVITIPPEWQDAFDDSGVEVRSRIDDQVDPAIVEELARQLPDFVRAYEPDGMHPGEFESFGASIKTLRQFLGALDRLVAYVRDVMLPTT